MFKVSTSGAMEVGSQVFAILNKFEMCMFLLGIILFVPLQYWQMSRFSLLGDFNMVHVILMVKSQHPGKGDNPSNDPITY